MKKRLIEKIAFALLIVAMAVNAFMLIRIWLFMRHDGILRENKISYILPDGFTPTRAKISWNEALPTSSGWVVRYASTGCIYCRLDFEWERLVPLLERLGYRTTILLPKETDEFEDDKIISENAQQMAFVKMDWIKQFRFTGTPTVIVFDNNGRVLWHHNGMMKNVDYESARSAISNSIK
jgi:thioredoxin-related protein